MGWLGVMATCGHGLHRSSLISKVRATPIKLLYPGRQCWHSAASEFHQPSTTCSTSLPAQHLRSPGLFSCQPHSRTLSRILTGTGPSVQTVSDVCFRRICLLDTSAFSTLEVLDDYYCYINLLTYLLIYLPTDFHKSSTTKLSSRFV